jgi:CheY-like chemotaxis protein
MPEGTRKTILAIDDDVTTLTSLRGILSGTYDVSLAKSADIAWTILNHNRVDLILLDVEMPKVSGLAFMEILKKLSAFYYLPVIFVTSHATPEVIRAAKESGARDFVVKPFAARTLLEKLENFFAAPGEPEGREALIRALHRLDEACRKGQAGGVENLVEEIARIHCNDLDMDARIIEICKYAQQFDYNEAAVKIGQALEVLSK